jgi:hypothetical protein
MVAEFVISEIDNEARADDTDQGERLGGVHAVLYPSAIAVLKRGEVGAGTLESKMESNERAGMEKSLCGNGLLQGSIPPAPATGIIKPPQSSSHLLPAHRALDDKTLLIPA